MMTEKPELVFAAVGDVDPENTYCIAGVSKVLPVLRNLGAEYVLVGCRKQWRMVKIPHSGDFDLAAAVKAAFTEKRPNIEFFELSGLPFALCNTLAFEEDDWKPFAAEHGDAIRKAKVFFAAQTLHPNGATVGDFLPRIDKGYSSEAFAGMKNCVLMSSGALGPLTDERSIRQGGFGFTSVATSTFRYAKLYAGRSNPPKSPLNRPGLLVSVMKDSVVIGRRVFLTGDRLGDDWVMQLDGYGAFSFENRSASSVPPKFSPGTELRIDMVQGKAKDGESAKKQAKITFPRAEGTRAFEYEVTVHSTHESDIDIIVTQQRFYSPGVLLTPQEEPAVVTCKIDKDDLYHDIPLDFEVRALDSFGNRSAPIFASRKIPADPLPDKRK